MSLLRPDVIKQHKPNQTKPQMFAKTDVGPLRPMAYDYRPTKDETTVFENRPLCLPHVFICVIMYNL